MAVATVELVLTGFVAVMLVSQILSLKAKVPYTLVLVFIGVGITAISSLASLGSNPDTNGTLNYSANCVPYSTLFPGSGAFGSSCQPLTSLPRLTRHGADPSALGFINQIAPGSTPFAFQAGAKFIF